jgi:hypothetical protein
MKPARSWDRMVVLPSRFSAKSVTVARVSAEVRIPATISTRGSTGAGLKKCTPTTRSGLLVTLAIFDSGMDDVLDARIASGLRIASSRRKRSSLRSSTSGTDSITMSASAVPAGSVTRWMRPKVSSASAAESRSERIARRTEASMRERLPSTLCGSGSTTTTSQPARAHTSAMPAPMVPPPITAIRSIAVSVRPSGRRSSVCADSDGTGATVWHWGHRRRSASFL